DAAVEGGFDDLQEDVTLPEQGDHRLIAREHDLDLCGATCHVAGLAGRCPRPLLSATAAFTGGRSHPNAAQPGGHPIGRPPSRWKWRWNTVWPASDPTFVTKRQ